MALPAAAEAPVRWIVTALLAIYLLVCLVLIFRVNINWDEFNYLAGIHAIQDGRASAGLNNFHAVLYAWLTAVPGMEIDRILVARVVQLGLFAGSMALLYLLARQLFSVAIALVVVFLAVSYTDILAHAFSFRFDPICLFFSLLALYLVQSRTGLPSAAIAGLALALSFLVSVKTVFYAIPIGVLMLYALAVGDDPRGQLKRIGVFAASTAFFFVAIYLVRTGAPAEGATGIAGEGSRAVTSLKHSGMKMFLEEGFVPKADYLWRGVAQNAGHWLLLGGGALIALVSAIGSLAGRRRSRPAGAASAPPGSLNRHRSALILICLLPLASVAIYRNAFPYFYVYVLPPALLAAGLAIEFAGRAANRLSARAGQAVLLAPVAFGMLTSGMFLLFEHREGIEKQRQVLTAIHQIFPEPVPYIDAHGMVSSFPKHGLWMSTWGMDNYHEAGTPVFEEILKRNQPVFKLVNHRALRGRGAEVVTDEDRYRTLLPEDAKILNENYIHHWGPLHVAGKRVSARPGHEAVSFDILIAGPYTLESDLPVLLDGQPREPGDFVYLDRGRHELAAREASDIRFRWGHNLVMPDASAPREWLYDGL